MQYYTMNLAVLGTTLLGLSQALVVPTTTENTSINLTARGFEPLTMDIDPDLTNPACGVSSKVALYIKHYQEDGESAECLKFKSYLEASMGDWSDGIDADFVATTCAGGKYTDPWADGKKKYTRVVFTPDAGGAVVNMAVSGTQKIAGSLAIDSPKKGRIATPRVQLGVTVDPKKNQQKYQYIYCA